MTPRPWRLTRRQRVEMEWALSRLREDVIGGAHRGPCAATGDGWRLLCGVSIIPYDSRMTEGEREAEDRIQALRVAIALRAALRADEDARCEEALGRVRRVYDGAAEDWCDELREWPPITYRRAGPEIPLVTVHPELADHPWAHGLTSRAYYVQLALWEVVR